MEDYIESILINHTWFTLLDADQRDALVDRAALILLQAPWYAAQAPAQEAIIVEQVAFILAHSPWIRSVPPERPNARLVRDSLDEIQANYDRLKNSVALGRTAKAHEPNEPVDLSKLPPV